MRFGNSGQCKYHQYLLLVAFAVVFAACAMPVPAQSQDGRQIQVSGSGEVFAKPDRVRLTFGVSERSKDLKAEVMVLYEAQ